MLGSSPDYFRSLRLAPLDRIGPGLDVEPYASGEGIQRLFSNLPVARFCKSAYDKIENAPGLYALDIGEGLR